jgi:hypothetical protein
MTTGSAPAHAAIAVCHGRERSRSLRVTPGGGRLRLRQAHGIATRRRQGGNRQQSRDNDAQNKAHDVPPASSGRPRLFPSVALPILASF